MLSTFLFVVLSCLFFTSDLSVHGFYGAPHCFLVATFLYTLADSDIPVWRLVLLVVGILYESFLITGLIGADLVLIVPLALTLSYVRGHIHLFPLVDALLVLVCVLITSAHLFNPLSLSGIALVWVILFHFLSALSMVYFIKR